MKPVYLMLFPFLTACTNVTENKNGAEDSNKADSTLSITSDNDFYRNGAKLISGYYNADSTTITWITITSGNKNFKIKFPFQPTNDTTTQIIDDQKIQIYSYHLNIRTSKLKDNNLGYSFSYHNRYKFVVNDATFDDLVKSEISEIEKTTNCKFQSQVMLKVSGAQGRELLYIFEGPDRMQIRERIIQYKKSVYKLIVITDCDRLFNYEISNFFKSFELLN